MLLRIEEEGQGENVELGIEGAERSGADAGDGDGADLDLLDDDLLVAGYLPAGEDVHLDPPLGVEVDEAGELLVRQLGGVALRVDLRQLEDHLGLRGQSRRRTRAPSRISLPIEPHTWNVSWRSSLPLWQRFLERKFDIFDTEPHGFLRHFLLNHLSSIRGIDHLPSQFVWACPALAVMPEMAAACRLMASISDSMPRSSAR